MSSEVCGYYEDTLLAHISSKQTERDSSGLMLHTKGKIEKAPDDAVISDDVAPDKNAKYSADR